MAAGPYLERMLPYDLTYGYQYNRIIDAMTNSRLQNTVAMTDAQAVCFGYQPVDSVFKARCRFWIPPNVDTIIRIYLSFTLQPFHVGNQTTSATTTTTGGGVTSAGGSAHNHSVSGQSTGGTTSNNTSFSTHQHTENLDPTYTQNATTSVQGPTPAHNHAVPAESVTGATSSSEATHTHTVPGQSVTIPSLSLNPPTAIYEAGMAQGVHAFLDGVDQTTPLGGPWGVGSALDISTLDITQYFTTLGWHEVQLSSTSIGGITVQMHFSSLMNGSI